MSYEHCDGHDLDATNGCPVCNPELPDSVPHLWACLKEARDLNDALKAENVKLVQCFKLTLDGGDLYEKCKRLAPISGSLHHEMHCLRNERTLLAQQVEELAAEKGVLTRLVDYDSVKLEEKHQEIQSITSSRDTWKLKYQNKLNELVDRADVISDLTVERDRLVRQVEELTKGSISKLFEELAAFRTEYVDAPKLTAERDKLKTALKEAEAALADIGDAEREPSDNLAWCEARAAKALPTVRASLGGYKVEDSSYEKGIALFCKPGHTVDDVIEDALKVRKLEPSSVPIVFIFNDITVKVYVGSTEQDLYDAFRKGYDDIRRTA